MQTYHRHPVYEDTEYTLTAPASLPFSSRCAAYQPPSSSGSIVSSGPFSPQMTSPASMEPEPKPPIPSIRPHQTDTIAHDVVPILSVHDDQFAGFAFNTMLERPVAIGPRRVCIRITEKDIQFLHGLLGGHGTGDFVITRRGRIDELLNLVDLGHSDVPSDGAEQSIVRFIPILRPSESPMHSAAL